MSRRSLRCASVLTLAACASLPLLARPASAVVVAPTDNVLIAADTDGDYSYGLYRAVGTTLSAVPGVPAENENLDIEQVSAARDGGRFVYVQDQNTATGILEQVVVREANGTGVLALDKHTISDSKLVIDLYPALSPDGSKLVFTQFTLGDSASGRVLWVDLANGVGHVVTGASDYLAWTWADSSTLISADDSGSVVSLPYTGGTPKAVSGVTPADGEFVVSPDGSKVAFTHITSAPSADIQTADVDVAPLFVSGSDVSIGSPTTLSGSLNNGHASWSPDGTTVNWVRNDGDFVNGPGVGVIESRPADASTAETTLSTSPAYADAVSVADTATDTTAPAATATIGTVTLAGTSASFALSVTNPDSDLAGIQITRTGGAAPKSFRLPAKATSFGDSGLVLGTDYSYTATPIDHSGNAGTPSAVKQLTAIAPVVSVTDPSTGSSTTETFRVGLPAYGTYGVRVRTNSGAATTWIAPDASTNHGAAHLYYGKRGTSYAFLITVTDKFGNSSVETASGGTTVPLDQTAASYAGNTAPVATSGQYLGSARILRAAGASASLVAKGYRISIIGERCASCGVMDVYVNGVRVASVDTRAASRQARQVLYSRPLSPGANATVVIKARGTAGRPNVVLDGFAVKH